MILVLEFTCVNLKSVAILIFDSSLLGTSNRTQKTGVFPGNYVTLARGGQRSPQSSATRENSNGHRNNKNNVPSQRQCAPPELPPRSVSPSITVTNASGTSNPISLSWHGQQDNVGVPIGRSSSAIMATQAAKSSEKVCFCLFNIVGYLVYFQCFIL